MMELLQINLPTPYRIVLSTMGIYFTVILFTRIAGKRSFSKMSSFDFSMTVAIGSVIASTILSPSISLVSGIIGLASIYILQILVAIGRRYKLLKQAVDNSPLLLMDGRKIIKDNLKKARVTESDLRSKLREANVASLDEVLAVIFETTGDISVLHKIDGDIKLDPWLLTDVQKS
ncbi:YetF domain-containing protein [Cytophaga sp. FL35]|uniref:DUF421 domain-containing protein n=1 Tax=Cytophaga sp. FL35 TaxID=1904456 RepID=UPI001653D526|nr:YetF domain-containing protein [Cytophaga sp. FL35]MBC7000747.1 DUF421 domain-containing protein [Cytophaga sp. FL35]